MTEFDKLLGSAPKRSKKASGTSLEALLGPSGARSTADGELANTLGLAQRHDSVIQGSDSPDSAKKHSKGILNRVGSNPIVKALGVLDLGRSAVVSSIHEASDALGVGDGHASWHDFVEQTKHHIGFSSVLDQYGVDNKLVRGIGGFIGDVALDPLTYLGGASALEGGNKALAKTLLEKGASEEVAARAVQRGGSALVHEAPEVLAEKLGTSGGIHFRVPGTGRVGRALGLAKEEKQLLVAGPESLAGRGANAVARGAQDALGRIRNTKTWDYIAKAMGGAHPELRELLKSADPHQVVLGLHGLDAAGRESLGVARATHELASQFIEAWKSDGAHLVDPKIVARTLGGEANLGHEFPALRKLLDETPLRAREMVAQAAGVDVSEIPEFIRTTDNYFPHMVFDEATKAKLKNTIVPVESGHTIQSFEYARTIKAGEEFIGVPIVRPGQLVDGVPAPAITEQVKRIGQAAHGDNWTELFSQDATKVLPLYFDSVARKVGQEIFNAHMLDTGAFKPIEQVVSDKAIKDVSKLAKFSDAESKAAARKAGAERGQAELAAARSSQPFNGRNAGLLKRAAAEKSSEADARLASYGQTVLDRLKNNEFLQSQFEQAQAKRAEIGAAWEGRGALEAHVADLEARVEQATQAGVELGQRMGLQRELEAATAQLNDLHTQVTEFGGPQVLGDFRRIPEIHRDSVGMKGELNVISKMLDAAKRADVLDTLDGARSEAAAMRQQVLDGMQGLGLAPTASWDDVAYEATGLGPRIGSPSNGDIVDILEGRHGQLMDHARGLHVEEKAAWERVGAAFEDPRAVGGTLDEVTQRVAAKRAALEAAGGDVAEVDAQAAHLEQLRGALSADGPMTNPITGDTKWFHGSTGFDSADLGYVQPIDDADEALGIQWTPHRDIAVSFSRGDAGSVVDAELHVKNPRVYEHVGSDSFPAAQEQQFHQYANGDFSETISQSSMDMVTDAFNAALADQRGAALIRKSLVANARVPEWAREQIEEALDIVAEGRLVGEDHSSYAIFEHEYGPDEVGLDQAVLRDVVGRMGHHDRPLVQSMFDDYLRAQNHDGVAWWNQHVESTQAGLDGSWVIQATNPAVINVADSQGGKFTDIAAARERLLKDASGVTVEQLHKEIGSTTALINALDPGAAQAAADASDRELAAMTEQVKRANADLRHEALGHRQAEYQLRQEAKALQSLSVDAAQHYEDVGVSEALRLQGIAKRSEAEMLRISDKKLVKQWGGSTAEYALGRRLDSIDKHLVDVISEGHRKIYEGVQTEAWLADVLGEHAKAFPNGKMSGFLRHFDKAQSVWKQYAILTPGFHFRNFMGGMFNNYVAGMEVGGYRRYLLAKVGGGDELTQRIEELGITSGGGQTGAEIARTGANPNRLNPIAPGFAPVAFSRGVGTRVENTLRGALAYDILSKGGTEQAAIDAVFKYHFNYDDLSHFEKTTARRVVPFYTWTRKNMPLQFEMMVRQPAKYTRYLAVKRNVEQMTSLEGIVPSYFGEQLGIRTPFKSGGSRDYVLPDLPFKDLGKALDPGQLLGQVSPALKLPLELFAGKRVFNDIPLRNNKTPAPRAWAAIPGLMSGLHLLGLASRDRHGGWIMSDRDAYKVESIIPPLSRARRLAPSEKRYQQRLTTTALSFLFGVGLQTNSREAQKSEVMRRDDQLVKLIGSLKDRGYQVGASR